MVDKIFGNALSSLLIYVPYIFLYLTAYRKMLRFSKGVTIAIVAASAVLRLALITHVRSISASAITCYNYIDLLILVGIGILLVKSRLGRMAFIGLMLKNTADTIVIIAKFTESLVSPEWANMGYHWTYTVFIALYEALLLPIVYIIIKRWFTDRIRNTISDKWRVLWVVPLFFYLAWVYTFYLSSAKTDLELACMPLNSLFLLLSITCQYLIYICIAGLIESLQREADLQAENSAMQLQKSRYEWLNNQIIEDRRLRHDLRHHFTVIASLARQQAYSELSDYVSQYIENSLWQADISYCAHTTLNVIVSYYVNKCSDNGICCRIKLGIPDTLPFSDTDTTVLFGNLLENAYDACLKQGSAKSPVILFYGEAINGTLLFTIENTYSGEIARTADGGFRSAKHEGNGIGIPSCVHIVEKYGGNIDFVLTDRFTVNMDFDLKQNEEPEAEKAPEAELRGDINGK